MDDPNAKDSFEPQKPVSEYLYHLCCPVHGCVARVGVGHCEQERLFLEKTPKLSTLPMTFIFKHIIIILEIAQA